MAIFGFRQGQGPRGQLPPSIGGQIAPPATLTPGDAVNANYYPGASPAGIPNVQARGWLDLLNGVQPLPATLEQQWAQSPRTRYRPFTAHTFEEGALPSPGAAIWAFTSLGLVEFSPIGTGIPNRQELLALEGAPYFPVQTVSIQGLGGIVQGNMALQPLVLDPISTAVLQG